MGTTYERLVERLTAFIRAQKLFLVATAPLVRIGPAEPALLEHYP